MRRLDKRPLYRGRTPQQRPIRMANALPRTTATANPSSVQNLAQVGAMERDQASTTNSSNRFDGLATELLQGIALYLNADQDLVNYKATCKATYLAIKDVHFWRGWFEHTYEKPRADGGVKSGGFEIEYKKRRRITKRAASIFFQYGNSGEERACLEMIRELVLDSFSEMTARDGGEYESKNLAIIENLARNTGIVSEIIKRVHALSPRNRETFRDDPNPLFRTVQVMLSPTILHLSTIDATTQSFEVSQREVYATPVERPIFIGCNSIDVNMEWILHQFNFWQYHMCREQQCTLYQAYANIQEHPRYWNKSLALNEEGGIGKHWKGAYGFVNHDQIVQIREGDGDESIDIQDEFCTDEQTGDFQNLVLTVNNDHDEAWNQVFETALNSLNWPPPSRARTRSSRHSSPSSANLGASIRFGGQGEDAEESFMADGWLNPLPPQSGIPGWKRMTMMKYFYHDDSEVIDAESLWAYEGVMLPGGQICVGRWWAPMHPMDDGNMYSGPFLLWCVDEKGVELGEGDGMTLSI